MEQQKKRWALAWTLGILAAVGIAWFTSSQVVRMPKGIAFAENTATVEMLSSPFKTTYEQTSPSVVGIQITTRTDIFGGRITSSSAYVGSGVVISEDGYVLTNYHVIDGAESIYVVSGDASYQTEYIAGDAESDIAVLHVGGVKLPAAKLGDSDALRVGDWALVIGNPLGEQFANTLTVGVVSGLDRNISSVNTSQMVDATNLIQTNAAINSGNSGGGMFNILGELVGITSMKLSNNGYSGYASIEGIGLAIPINTAKKIVNDLIAYGHVVHPRIGVSIREINSPSLEPTKNVLPRSIWITAVEQGAPADKAGIQTDDLIVEVDGRRVTTSSEMRSAIRAHKIGEKVQVKVYRIPGLRDILADEEIPVGEYIDFSVEVKVLEADL